MEVDRARRMGTFLLYGVSLPLVVLVLVLAGALWIRAGQPIASQLTMYLIGALLVAGLVARLGRALRVRTR